MQAVAAALDAVAPMLGHDREYSRRRRRVIASTAELRERELIKMATLAAALGEALRARGVAEPEASLAAEAGIATFRVAWAQWLSATEDRDLAEVMRESLSRLEALVAEALSRFEQLADHADELVAEERLGAERVPAGPQPLELLRAPAWCR